MFMYRAKIDTRPKTIKVLLMAVLTALLMVGCGNQPEEEGTNGSDESYRVSDFLDQAQYPNEVFSEAMTAYQDLVGEYPIQHFLFEDEITEQHHTVNEILNNFETDAKAQHMAVDEQEEYLFYEFDSEEKLDSEAENSEETIKAYIGLYFIGGQLVEAGVFTNQTDFDDESFLSNEETNEILAEGNGLQQLGESQPTMVAFAQMNYEEGIHTSPGVISKSSSGGNILQLPIYDPSLDLVKVNNENLRLINSYNINTEMINGLLGYYTEDILGFEAAESEEALPGGALMPYEDFEKGVNSIHEKAKAATEESPLTLDQVKEVMGQPRNQTAEAVDYHSQKGEGVVEIFTVVFNEDEEITSISIQTQANTIEFPFNMEEFNSLGSLPADTTINQIEEIYAPAPIKELNLESNETMYMWYSDDEEAEINIVQIMADENGAITGIAYDGNQPDAEEADEEAE